MFLQEIFSRTEASTRDFSKNRIQFIDLAKGICILLVLIDHCSIQTGIWVNHLRMPLYFILSGLFFKDYGSFIEFLRKKTNNILIPFLTFYGVGLVYAIIIDVLCHNSLDSYSIGMPAFFHDGSLNNYALWFLLSLFWVNLIFWGISVSIKQERIRGTIVLGLSSLSYFINAETGHSFLYIGSALLGLPFFYIGYFLRKTNILSSDSQRTTAPIWGGVLIISILITEAFSLNYIRFANAVMQEYRILHYTACVLGVCGLLTICKQIVWLPIISYMGRYSIIILVTHPMVAGASEVIFRRLIPSISQDAKHFAMLCTTVVICIVLIIFLKRYCPKVTAQADFFPKKASSKDKQISF